MSIIRNMQNLKQLIIILMLVSPAIVLGADTNIGRIYPTDKVDIYKNGVKVNEFSSEVPLPNGLLISCRGKCTVKTDWLTLAVDDGSQLSITMNEFRRELYLKKGSLKYILSDYQTSGVLRTPCAQVPFVSVPGDEIAKGDISASSVSTEISLLVGGLLVISGPEGEVEIEPGKKALFLCSGPFVTLTVTSAISAAGTGVAGSSVNPAVAGVAGTMIAIPVAADVLDEEDDDTMSPFQP